MPYTLALVPVFVLVIVLYFFIPVVSRLMKSSNPSELTAEWFESFHIDTYKPMLGLLADDDFNFLNCQPGFEADLHRKLRKDRLRIFREYMNRLVADYNRMYLLATFVISQSTDDQSKFFATLLRMRLNFWLATFNVEFNYRLFCLGVNRVSLGGLFQQMEAISRLASVPPAREMLIS